MVLGQPIAKNKSAYYGEGYVQGCMTEGRFTIHSLRVTDTTALFDAGVSEVVIQKYTDHKSINALRQYECVTTMQNQLVTNVLQPVPELNSDPFDLKKTWICLHN